MKYYTFYSLILAPMKMNSKALVVSALWLTLALLSWCSTSTNTPQQQYGSNTQVWSANSSTNSDPLAWLTDIEIQFMKMFIKEWKQRLTLLWKWRQSIDDGNERTDIIGWYSVYTRILATYPNKPDRKKILVAVYQDWWVPVQSLEDVSSTNKRWNILIDGKSYTPYMDSGFFFESEFTDEWNSELTVEFKINWEEFSENIKLP